MTWDWIIVEGSTRVCAMMLEDADTRQTRDELELQWVQFGGGGRKLSWRYCVLRVVGVLAEKLPHSN